MVLSKGVRKEDEVGGKLWQYNKKKEVIIYSVSHDISKNYIQHLLHILVSYN